MPQDKTFTLARLSLVHHGSQNGSAQAISWKHIEGPVYLNIKHVTSKVRLELAGAKVGAGPLMTAIVNRLAPSAKLEPTTARFKAIGVRAALSFPSDHHTPTSGADRFQCVFQSQQDAIDCGKLLSPYFVDISHMAPNTGFAAKPRPAAVVNPAQSATAQAYSQSSKTESSAQSQTPTGRKSGGQKGTKRKADKDSLDSPAKKGKKVTAPPAPSTSVTPAPAGDKLQVASLPSANSPSAVTPQNDGIAAMKADLLRNFGASSSSQTAPITKEADVHASGTSGIQSRHHSSNSYPSTTQHTGHASSTDVPSPGQIETDLLPRSPLINASSQTDPPLPTHALLHLSDLLSLDPAGFVPNDEIMLVNTAYPVMHTAEEEKAEAMRVKAEEAEFEDGPQNESAPLWTKWEGMSDEQLYHSLCHGMIPESFLATAYRIVHLHNQLGASQTNRSYSTPLTYTPLQDLHGHQQDLPDVQDYPQQYGLYQQRQQETAHSEAYPARQPRLYPSYPLQDYQAQKWESYEQHQAYNGGNNDMLEIRTATQGLELIDDLYD